MFDEKYYETSFFEIIEDLKDYLPHLTLVGGWLPWVYMRFLWKLKNVSGVHTTDVDFGISAEARPQKGKTVFEKLSASGYRERHVDMGRLYPVVLFKEGRIRLDFIMSESGEFSPEAFLGREIYVNRVENFDFLLENRIKITAGYKEREYGIYCPEPGAFVLHKCLVFPERREKEKRAKDLYYAYLLLRRAPEGALAGADRYEEKVKLKVIENIKKNFVGKTSDAVILVEKEHGADFYIEDLREDILVRFNKYAKILERER